MTLICSLYPNLEVLEMDESRARITSDMEPRMTHWHADFDRRADLGCGGLLKGRDKTGPCFCCRKFKAPLRHLHVSHKPDDPRRFQCDGCYFSSENKMSLCKHDGKEP